MSGFFECNGRARLGGIRGARWRRLWMGLEWELKWEVGEGLLCCLPIVSGLARNPNNTNSAY